jgi:hypothetical protein
MAHAEKQDRRTSGAGALGVGVTIGVVLLLVVGWFGFDLYRSSQVWTAMVMQAPAFAQKWVQDVRGGRLDEAYAATTAAYRARVDRNGFEKWIAEHPELEREPVMRGWSTSTLRAP